MLDSLYDLDENITLGGTMINELENFNPEAANDVFHAAEAMDHWEYQGDTNRCAQFSQLFVIEEFTGLELNPDEFCAFSEANGWFSERGGTPLENMNKMLDAFGIENELSDGNTFQDLLNCFEKGGRAIVAVDSGEYWDGEGYWDDVFDPHHPDHAIEVVGFDPETNSVIVNDSGNPNGRGSEIPLDTVLDAWEDSDNMMVKCYGIRQ